MEETLMAAPMSRDAQRTGAPAAAATSGAGAARTERWSWTLPPRKEKALNCRRCNSDSTMFCYYTNYSLTRPRHYCKTCRRYWIEGARRRNAPVGGGARGKKDRRPRSPAAAAASSSPGAVPNGGVSTGVEASRACVFPAKELVVRSAAAGGYVPPRHGSATGEVVRMAPPPQSESVVLGFSLGTPGARGVPGGGGLQEAAAGRLLLPFEHLSLAPRREAQREEIDGDQGGDGGAFLRR